MINGIAHWNGINDSIFSETVSLFFFLFDIFFSFFSLKTRRTIPGIAKTISIVIKKLELSNPKKSGPRIKSKIRRMHNKTLKGQNKKMLIK